MNIRRNHKIVNHERVVGGSEGDSNRMNISGVNDSSRSFVAGAILPLQHRVAAAHGHLPNGGEVEAREGGLLVHLCVGEAYRCINWFYMGISDSIYAIKKITP